MSGVASCRQCGCSEIDTDPSRGDAVCTNCGFVLEESIIVSEVTFEEDGHGVASAVGQFVSAESRGGGAVGGGVGFHSGIGKESREITLRAAKKRITDVAQQLRLNQHCIDVAFNFFKMALHKQITKGRRHPLTIAACVYMTCRMEGTPHLLIDFSDVVQMDVYALGRAYLQISRALFINIPSIDPCMYILRFAHKFNLEPKTHEVSVTALRLVQRMKRDWIHFGRRPSGLCGAALLIAARIHGFSRTVQDIINVVKVHETTLRRRLIEFGETPSSSLTMEEFMTVDLEEEHDPPAFKAARVKDRDQLQKLLDNTAITDDFDELQEKIESELERKKTKRKDNDRTAHKRPHPFLESQETDVESRVIEELTMSSITQLVSDTVTLPSSTSSTTDLVPATLNGSAVSMSLPVLKFKPDVKIKRELKREMKSESMLDPDRALMPPPSDSSAFCDYELEMGDDEGSAEDDEDGDGGELDLTGIDDNEIDAYIMNDVEAERKRILWEKLNNEYIVSQEQKRIQMEEDIKAGKFDKKRKPGKEKGNKEKYKAKTAGEAIKIMLEKKLSSKINYEVLKSLSSTILEPAITGTEVSVLPVLEEMPDEFMTVIESGPVIPKRNVSRGNEEMLGSNTGRSPRKRYKSESESISSLKSSSSVSVMIDPDTKSIILKPMKGDAEKGGEIPRSISFNMDRTEIIEEVVVEEGPLVIESRPLLPQSSDHSEEIHEEYGDTEEVYEDDEEDEGEGGLSASQLLTQFRGETGEDYEEDYY